MCKCLLQTHPHPASLHALQNEYPWMAYLVLYTDNGRYRCAGTLITDTLILSAAHCMSGQKLKYIKVRVNQP